MKLQGLKLQLNHINITMTRHKHTCIGTLLKFSGILNTKVLFGKVTYKQHTSD